MRKRGRPKKNGEKPMWMLGRVTLVCSPTIRPEERVRSILQRSNRLYAVVEP